MNFDYSSLLGGGLLLGIIGSLVISIVSLLVLYLVIRGAVRGGLRDHQHWLERNRPTQPPALPAGSDADR